VAIEAGERELTCLRAADAVVWRARLGEIDRVLLARCGCGLRRDRRRPSGRLVGRRRFARRCRRLALDRAERVAQPLDLCYICHMRGNTTKRAGSTRTFSVSVDAKTKRALRALADAEFGGNLSALVSDFAEEARRRLAAGEYLRKHRISKLGESEAAELQSQIDREVALAKRRRSKRRAA
jgi:hypothetical protein